MRIIFMGTPEFAVPSLETLINNNFNVVAVITAPDKLGGRGRKQLIESDVKKFALQRKIPILQPTNLKAPEFIRELKDLNADLQFVVAFRMLPEVVWDMPPLGTFNLHGSLLPLYRGAAPINWAIINGDEMTGLTTFKLRHAIDTGSLVFQQKVPIYRSDNAMDLHDRMKIAGAALVLKTVKVIQSGNIRLMEQDDSNVSKAPKIFHEDCELNWHLDTFTIYNLIRGLSPYPTAWSNLDGRKLKIFKVKYTYEIHQYQVGTYLSDSKSYLKVTTANGFIFIEELQMEGRKRMLTSDFLNGLNFKGNKTQIQLVNE